MKKVVEESDRIPIEANNEQTIEIVRKFISDLITNKESNLTDVKKLQQFHFEERHNEKLINGKLILHRLWVLLC